MITMNMKSFFLDRRRVMRYASRAKRREGMRAGGLIRAIARRSLRKRKRYSRPGEPPSSHHGLLKRLLYFAWDPSTESIVIGPQPIARIMGGQVPGVLEHGGVLHHRRRRRGGKIRRYTAHYEPRPYMAPAIEKAIPRIPRYWRNAIRG